MFESEYVVAYVSQLSNIREDINNSNRTKVAKVYSEPTFENIKEQAEYAVHNGYKNFGVYIENLKDTEGMKNDLREALGIDVNVYSSLREDIDDSEGHSRQNANANVQKRTVYIVNPFSPMLFFTRKGDGFSRSMVGYCREVVDWVDAHKTEYDHYYFIPFHLQKGAGTQLPEGTWREFNNEFLKFLRLSGKDYTGTDTVLSFFNLNVPNGIEIASGVTSVDTLKKSLMNGASIVTTADYQDINFAANKGKINTKVKICNYTFNYMNADPSVRIQKLISEYNKANPADKESKEAAPKLLDQYLYYIVGNRETNAVKGSIKAAKAGKGLEFDLDKGDKINNRDNFYKQTRDAATSGSADYWLDSGPLGYLKQYNNPNGDEHLNKSNDNIAFLLNQKGKDGKRRVDASVEKIYNLGHFGKDMLGLVDNDERYDAAKWESDQKKLDFAGVAGKELFDVKVKINKNIDEMTEIEKEINELIEDDPDYEKDLGELTDRLKTLSAENKELRAKIDANEANTSAIDKINKNESGVETKQEQIHDTHVNLKAIRSTKTYGEIEQYFCIG